ncbi:MAG: LD-carboxypeptidase, partial [Muribaculaceae bacterium]|nr:LD-carboxypeptidase [Muribaculaceae bacterium]
FDILSNAEILFVEDIAEPVYKVERMLYSLRLSGALARLKGLVVGQFTDYPNPDRNGDSMETMIRRIIEPYSFPVAFNFPIGHFSGNVPVVEGAMVRLCVNDNSTILEMI